MCVEQSEMKTLNIFVIIFVAHFIKAQASDQIIFIQIYNIWIGTCVLTPPPKQLLAHLRYYSVCVVCGCLCVTAIEQTILSISVHYLDSK